MKIVISFCLTGFAILSIATVNFILHANDAGVKCNSLINYPFNRCRINSFNQRIIHFSYNKNGHPLLLKVSQDYHLYPNRRRWGLWCDRQAYSQKHHQ